MRHLTSAACAFAFVLTTVGRADIDPKNFDTSVKPQDDFYHYADGTWLKNNPIPAAYSAWGAFYELQDRNQAALHTIAERWADPAVKRTSVQQKVGDLYASGMNEAAVNAAGVMPLQPEFDQIAQVNAAADVCVEITHLHSLGIPSGFVLASEQDPKASDQVIAGVGQGGLGLPDRDYYFRDDAHSAELRKLYVAHVAKMLGLAGDSPTDAAAEADAVMKLETALAKGSRSAADLRDPVANYHKLPLADVAKLTPHFDWTGYLATSHLSLEAIDVGQPEFFGAFDAVLASTSPADWRAYFRWNLIHATAPFLSAPFVDENFNFFGKTLTGTPQMRERWKRVMSTIDGSVGEALGQLYVAVNFPPESKARMLHLVANLRAALRARIQTLEWMDAPTRAKALAKLDAFGVKIGYPDKWIDYSSLQIDRGAYVANVLRAQAFAVKRDLHKIGRPLDRGDWQMTPPTVNAYYDPSMNEVVFPAGILQPPFFDAKADDAVNYGGIGAVIGHEMTHGFDDQGRQFDGKGNLTDWWTPESAARFKVLAAGIVKQFDGYVAVGDLHVNGALTQGENIADLGGIKIAYAAFQHARLEHPSPTIGGLSPEQRFFISWATVWRTNQRPEAVRLQVNTNPHSPAEFRCNGPLSNLDEFAKAFAVPEGAPMRRSPADRVTIW